MASIINKGLEQVTKRSMGAASSMLEKLAKKDGSAHNISTISFPSNLENQAQATYMVIYIFDNINNKQKFSDTVFDSGVEDDTYEIKAVSWLKDQFKSEVLDPLKKNLKDAKKAIITDAKDWLTKQKESIVGDKDKDKTKPLTLFGYDVKETLDLANEWVVPHRKKSESSALKDQLDPVKSLSGGYKLEKAIQIQMPSSTISYKYENGWESTDTSTLNSIRTLIEGVKNLFGDEGENAAGKQKLQNILTQITNKVGDAVTGGGFTADQTASKRQVYNPVLVFNYTVPTPRTFSYSFSLYPRNKKELYDLYNLIQTLKFYALPEVGNGELKNANVRPTFFNYPAKFSIKFYTNGYENKWFPKTMALGLTSIEESLTGDNGDMAFFENYFDRESGNPPRMVDLTLTFKELGIMSREYANLGY